MWCLLVKGKYLELILKKAKVWKVRSQKLFNAGDRIALGNTGTRLIEGFATVAEVKKLTTSEMKKYNDKHLANDFIEERWNDRPWLYAYVLSDVIRHPTQVRYPRSYGGSKVDLNRLPPALESRVENLLLIRE